MHIQIHLHGILRDQLPPEARGRAQVALAQGATVADLLKELGITRRVVASVNEQELADHHTALQDGDCVVVLVEIGGGCAPFCWRSNTRHASRL